MAERIRRLLSGRFARDTMATQVSLAVSTLFTLGTSVVLWRGLGQEGYGRYALVFALFGLVNILGDLGLGRASVSRMAKARGAGDRAAYVEQVAYLLKMALVISAAVTVLGAALAPALSRLVYAKPEIGPYTRVLFLASVAGAGRTFGVTLLAGMRRMKTLAVYEALLPVLRLAAVGGAIVADLGLWGVVWAQIGATLVVSLAAGVLYRSLARSDEALPGLGELTRLAVRVPWRSTFKVGALLTLDRQLVKVIDLVPIFVLGRLSDSTVPAGYFNLARNVVRHLGLGFSGAAKNLLPFFAELRGKRQIERLRRNYRRTVVGGGAAALVIAACCLPLLRPVLSLLYGDGRAVLAAVAAVLLARFVVDGFCLGVEPLIVITERAWWAAKLKMASLVPGVGLLVGATLLGREWASDPLLGMALGAAGASAAWWMAVSLVQLAGTFRSIGSPGVLLSEGGAEPAAADVSQAAPDD